jgi:hypothetical protein
VGLGPESFSDDQDPGTVRTFSLQVCYYEGATDVGPTTVSATITDGDGRSHPASVVLGAPGDCADLGPSQGDPATPSPTPTPTPTPTPNHPPVAVADHWDVRAGDYVYDNALRNDRDPDGDAITPRVTSISFRAAEWSGMERDGTFRYVSGPGTRVHQRKVVTYYLLDARGARSAPARITIDVIPPGTRRSASPVHDRRHRASAAAAATPHWYSNPTLMYSCFGSGFDTSCYGVYSPRQVVAINAATPWITRPTAAEAARACAKAFGRGGVGKCVSGLLTGPIFRAGDKQIIRLAAEGGDCLLFKQELNRTALHPLAGEWTRPEYSQTHSFLGIGRWGVWSKGLTGTWQVPVSCTADAAWKFFPRSLVER